jgi:hypothetical protein
VRKMLGIILALACSVTLTKAVSQTPSDKKAFAFEPYMFGLGCGRAAFTVSCLDQGYTVTEPYEAEGDANNGAGITEWLAGLSGGYGTFLIVSHGLSLGMAVEAYRTEALRNTAWFALPDTTEYYRNSSEHGYHISMWAMYLVGAKYPDEAQGRSISFFRSPHAADSRPNTAGREAQAVTIEPAGLCP